MATDTTIHTVIPVAVFMVMFALGLGLTLADFRSALRRPKALLLGIATQMVLVPVVGLLLVLIQRQESAIALGIIVLVLCPGGGMSNLLTRLAGGDVALSVSLTAVTNLLSVATMPALSVLAASHFLDATGERIEIRDLALRVVMIATVPVLLGMAIRQVAPRLAKRHEATIFRVAFTVFLLIVCWAVIESIDALRDGMVLLGWELALLTLLLLGLGQGVAWLFGLDPQQRVTVALEAGVQNSGLGLAAGAMLWADPTSFPLYGTASAVYGVLTYLLTFPLVLLLSRRRARI